MKNILTTILQRKREEIAQRKISTPLEILQTNPHYYRNVFSLRTQLTQNPLGVIAEFKKKSPSKGVLHESADIKDTVKGYQQYGAAAISCLTDMEFFGGSDEDFIQARAILNIPLLRKDFIIDNYQLHESKALGADVILLIAAALEPIYLKELAHEAKTLGLEVLLEVHDEEELEKNLNQYIDVVGVNNRNLKTFEVDLQTSYRLARQIPLRYAKISESGISSPFTVLELKKHGFDGFLIGENFMKTSYPTQTFKNFMQELQQLLSSNQ
ncbi:MAG: indole-3-glycerol phosphate synthase TrpC [Cytophagales bacterium]|nr:indole-3-glycerol phosphate synthase TrpC [Cytophagales bacterium]MDW8384652.1 indole-3-glycerol phosphate synthase TrpC [Flammeovirgaceae bacterium]